MKISDMLTKSDTNLERKLVSDMDSVSMFFDDSALKLSRKVWEQLSAPPITMSLLSKNTFFDSPEFKYVQGMQNKLSDITFAAHSMADHARNMIGPEASAMMLALKNQQDMTSILGKNGLYGSLFPKNSTLEAINASLKASTFDVSAHKMFSINFDFLKTLDPSTYDFTTEEGEEFVSEDYELDVVPPEQSEKKIVLLHEVSRLQTTMEEIYQDNNKLYTLKPRDFESMIGELLRHKNFEVELTKQTRDGGYDLIALQNLGEFPLRFLVECKRYAPDRPVGIEIIRAFSHVVRANNANKGILFTTSYFTKDARQDAQTNMPYHLDFREKGDILEWIRSYIQAISK